LKKGAFVIIFLIFVSCFFGRFNVFLGAFEVNVALAETEERNIEKELQEEVSKQLANLDFSQIETSLADLSQEAKELFSASSFSDKLLYVMSGQYVDSSGSFFSSILSIFWKDLKKSLPLISIIISISILGGMISSLKPISSNGSIGNIIHFVSYGTILVILGTSILQVIKLTSNTLSSVKSLFNAIFPILLTILTALGGSVSVGIYQPAVAMLGNVFVSLITYVLLPMFIFSIVFSIVGNLSNNVKLDKFVEFLQSAFKWTMGLCFTIFLGFISIQGIVAGSIDGLSIRTAKYAIKSYVPIVGNYLSDGMSIIMASSALIKNAIGGVGLFLLLSMMVSPILNIVLFMLALKLMSGVIEMIGDKKISSFLSSISKSLALLIALLVAVTFMYVVLTGLVMCSANLI